MRALAEDELDDLYLQVNGHPGSFQDLLRHMLQMVVDRIGADGGSIRLRDLGTLTVRRDGRGLAARWIEDGGTPASTPDGQGLSTSISYGKAILGELWLGWADDAVSPAAAAPVVAALARQAGFLAQRYAVRRWALERFGRPLLLVGMSPRLRRLEAFLERAAGSALPVLLCGEFGTEKALLAAMIHACGPRRDHPFVQIHCADPEGAPDDWFARAEGGTLLLNDVDDLSPQWQNHLPRRLLSQLELRLDTRSLPNVRVIATTTADLGQRVREGAFSRRLLAALDVLSATVPPLRERDGDMRALLAAALERQGDRPEERMSDELVELCRAYTWPENLYELDRVVARLAVLGESGAIGRGDVMRHAPWVLAEAAADPPAAPRRPAPRAPEKAGPDIWAARAMDRDGPSLARLHPGLRKALVHLGRDFAEAVPMNQLARLAGVSPSHLTFLFRSELGLSFKMLLAHIRIRRAKEILEADPRRPITEVALQAGFADLSHFEKTFRKLVGQTPRAYRRGAGS